MKDLRQIEVLAKITNP